MKITNFLLFISVFIITVSCGDSGTNKTEDMSEIKLMTLDPGHFHAALVQKSMYEGVSSDVFVFAPEGDDVNGHLERIKAFNNRAENPTSWIENVYTGDDFFEQMIIKRPGNILVLSGNNQKKTDYILKALESGINVLADKPMLISPEKFPLLEEAFKTAKANNVLLYDIMTERHEITTMLQKELSSNQEIFGDLVSGSPEKPAVTKESVHHFFKYVSGSPLVRPPWFFDTRQQGEGIVDVTTHLVDLIQWECYPEVVLSKSDIEIVSARRWPTIMSPDDFTRVTGLNEFPEYLSKDIIDGNLHVYANGEIVYKIKDTYAMVVVEWKYQAPEGSADTHYSIMRGSVCDLIIRQGKNESFKPTLYITAHQPGTDFEAKLSEALKNLPWEGIRAEKLDDNKWKLIIPDKYKLGHEAHFRQVTKKYLDYLKKGELPEWEVPNMIVKYYTTTEGLKKAME